MNDPDARSKELHALGERLGITIGDERLFDRALTHASMAAEAEGPTSDYESLEFLGDAVLGLAVSDHLFAALPGRTPGDYSAMRASLVNRRCVARVAKDLGIASVIRLGKGEELSGGRRRGALMGDCLEALIGAIYLDSGWDAARKFVVRVLEKEIERAGDAESILDYKSMLQNYCQARKIALPKFGVVRAEGPDHKKEFEVQVRLREEPAGFGTGATKKEAEQNAAREALRREGQEVE